MAYAPPLLNEVKMKKNNRTEAKTEKAVEIYPETNRPLIRPQINWFKAVIIFVAVLMIDIFVAYLIISFLPQFEWYSQLKMSVAVQYIIVFLLLSLISLFFLAKRIIIFIIRVYQRYAPYEIRSTCLFIPNCSEYMILAIEKYGLVKGIKKGIDRFNRCHDPNGGEDYP